jgi:prepilin-type N-terminal cleavage/methylation domain-containing protein
MPSHPSRSHGLTLIELIVVLAVLVLLVGISLAGLAGIGTVRQQGETNRIAAMLRFAYSRAISDGLYVRMRIDITEDKYWIEGTANPVLLPESRVDVDLLPQDDDAARDARAKAAKSGFIRLSEVIKVDEGVTISEVRLGDIDEPFDAGKVDIHFFPNGFAEPALIYTYDGDEEYITLSLNPMTGVVKSTNEKVDPSRFFGQPDDVEDEGR